MLSPRRVVCTLLVYIISVSASEPVHYVIQGAVVGMEYNTIRDVTRRILKTAIIERLDDARVKGLEEQSIWINKFEEQGRKVGKPSVVFNATVTTKLSRAELIVEIQKVSTIVLLYCEQTDVPQIEPEAVTGQDNIQPCLNDGVMLSNNTCLCPIFVSGTNCEVVGCKRMGIPDNGIAQTGRCTCPPGWYAMFCELRGCRPPVKDNMDNAMRSMILVINTAKSLATEIATLTANLNATMTALTANGNWVKNYILYTYIDTPLISTQTASNIGSLSTVIEKLSNILLLPTNITQQHTAALNNAQQTIPEMKAHSIVLHLLDSLPSDTAAFSPYLTGVSNEQLVQQSAMQWRNKITAIFSTPSPNSNQQLFQSDPFVAFRRTIGNVKGDLLVIDKNNAASELGIIMSQLVTTFALTETTYATFNTVIAGQAIFINPGIDAGSTTANLLITYAPGYDGFQTFTVAQNNQPLVPVVKSSNFALYTVVNSPVTVSGDPDTKYDLKVYTNSYNTVLMSFVDEIYIDVGNTIIFNENSMNMLATAYVLGSAAYDTITYEPLDLNTGLSIRVPFTAFIRALPDCTHSHMFNTWLLCPPGPFTLLAKLYKNNSEVLRRIIPGFCSLAEYTSSPYVGPPMAVLPQLTGPMTQQDALQTCSAFNFDVLSDGRTKKYRQYIVGLERSPTMLANNMVDALYKLALFALINYDSYTQFTLVAFDDRNVDVLISTYDYTIFRSEVKDLLNDPATFSGPLNTRPRILDAIYEATRTVIISPAIMYIFTTTYNTYVNLPVYPIPRDFQANVFLLSNFPTEPLALMSRDLLMATRQSNGRILPIAFNEVYNYTATSFSSGLDPVIQSMTTQTQLIIDATLAATDNHTILFPVEKGVLALEITIVGTNATVQINDPTGNTAQKQSTIFSGIATTVITVDLTNSSLSGLWSLSLSPTDMIVQVRAASTFTPFAGFASDPTNDFPATNVFTYRGQNNGTRVLFRAVDSNPNATAAPSVQTVSIYSNFQALPTQNADIIQTVNQKDPATCAYQYSTDIFSLMNTDIIKMIFTGVDGSGTAFQRTAFYAQPQTANPTSVCHGGSVNIYGECACPTGYHGEYCWDRICVNGGTASRGVCMCHRGYFGDFCDIPNRPYNTLNTTIAPLPTSTAPLVTQPPTSPTTVGTGSSVASTQPSGAPTSPSVPSTTIQVLPTTSLDVRSGFLSIFLLTCAYIF